jgi:hypothetical protein
MERYQETLNWRLTASCLLLMLVAWTVACSSGTTPDIAAAHADAAVEGTADWSGPGELGIAVCSPENGPFSAEISNPYLPFVVGSVHVLEGMEGGTEFARFQIEVMDETMEIAGVTTRVVEKRDLTDDEPSEPEREFFAQAPDGTVCLFGEEGAWEADKEGYLPAIHMPGTPVVGLVYEMVHGPDYVEMAEITHVGVATVTPAGTFEDTVVVLEDGPSIKKYAREVGEIYDDGIELVSF